MDVEFASHEPFNFLELLVVSDLDGDGDVETIASVALRSLAATAGDIPTTSLWGTTIMALILLTALTIMHRRRERALE